MSISHEQVLQAHELVRRGTPVAEIAEKWGIGRTNLYKAFGRYGLKLEHPPAAARALEHIEGQITSGVPPELYAYRAGISEATMRRWNWEHGIRATTNTYAERKAYWQDQLELFDPANAKGFCTARNLPLPMTALWYHRIHNPQALLLELETDQFQDFQRYAIPASLKNPPLFALGFGRNAVPIGMRIANEAYRFARKYQPS
jgi:hypothetical protein